MAADPALRIFPDEFVPNIQSANRTSYSQWVQQNPGEAARWVKFRDDVIAGKQVTPPAMTTKFGKALVAAGKEHMGITHSSGAPVPAYPPPVVTSPPSGPPPLVGDKFASPTGSDSNPGTLASPYLTVTKLQTSLAPGQVGQFRAGTYGTASSYYPLTASGTAGGRITLTNYPGESVTIKGQLDITGDYVTFQNLHIDGSNNFLTSQAACGSVPQALGITTKGSNLIFEYCEIYQSGLKGSGFLQGTSTGGNNTIFRYNKIHDIGFCQHFDHGIYAGDGTGMQAYGNWIWNNPHGWGFQMYPSPNDNLIFANVIDACGSGFVIADNGSATCTGNDIYNNVITNSVGLVWAGTAGAGLSGIGVVGGTNNKFRDNCCYNNPDGIQTPGHGTNVSVTGNFISDPLFFDRANHDYRINPGSPCASFGLPTFVVGPTV